MLDDRCPGGDAASSGGDDESDVDDDGDGDDDSSSDDDAWRTAAWVPEDVPHRVFVHSNDEGTSVNAVCFCPGGAHLVSAGSDCRIRLWHLASMAVVACFEHVLPKERFCCLNTATINAVAVSHDGSSLAAGGYDCALTVWQLPQVFGISDAKARHA